jgi:hypothetical protein
MYRYKYLCPNYSMANINKNFTDLTITRCTYLAYGVTYKWNKSVENTDTPFYGLQQSILFTVSISTNLAGISWRCSKSIFTKITQEICKLEIKTH